MRVKKCLSKSAIIVADTGPLQDAEKGGAVLDPGYGGRIGGAFNPALTRKRHY
ncbi:MAG: hypothetical protein AAFQ04_12960 [Pseudomonadota bacterium]